MFPFEVSFTCDHSLYRLKYCEGFKLCLKPLHDSSYTEPLESRGIEPSFVVLEQNFNKTSILHFPEKLCKDLF